MIERLALTFSFAPDEAEVDRSLEEFKTKLLDGWRCALPMSDAVITAGVDGIIDAIRTRRREIERAGFGVS